MFSGIIGAVGEVVGAGRGSGGATLEVRVARTLANLEPGASVAVNGACLTVVKTKGNTLYFNAVGATLERTLLGVVTEGDRVNLEQSLRLGSPVDGHLVTGHVDGVGTVTTRRREEGAVYFQIRAPEELAPQIAPRGSIAVDGVSLTVAGAEGAEFTVSIVPYTLEQTIMGDYQPGRRVHLETDILAKYVQGALRTQDERQALAAWFAGTEKT